MLQGQLLEQEELDQACPTSPLPLALEGADAQGLGTEEPVLVQVLSMTERVISK